MDSKHILVISQYFYPESFRINDICCEWVKRGYKVTVVTGIPNYPAGNFFPGYNWFKNTKEDWEGIRIIRIPLIPRGKTFVGMVLNYLSFVVSGFFWSAFTRLRADCVFTFEVSPMTQALLGVWYSKRCKIKNYLYVQDLWPENIEVITGIHSPAVIKPIQKMVDYIYQNCVRIFTTSPSFVKKIQQRIPNDASKVIYWPQYAEEFYCPTEKQSVPEIPDDGRFKIVFTGNIGRAQGLEVLVPCAKRLAEQGEKDVCFVIVGDGRDKLHLLQEIGKYQLEDVFVFVDRQPAGRIPELLAVCDAAFVSFMDNELFANTIPAKLQSYMACGMPILACASGETERIVREANCGICCPLGNSDMLTQSICEMKVSRELPVWAAASRQYFLEHFEKHMLMDQMEAYLRDPAPTSEQTVSWSNNLV